MAKLGRPKGSKNKPKNPDQDYQDYYNSKTLAMNFVSFTKELAKLSEKYGIVLSVTGGVYIYTPREQIKVQYTDDYSSGDIYPYVNGQRV